MHTSRTYTGNEHFETSETESRTACKTCNLVFTTWEEYENHLLNSQAHRFCCDICLIDFRHFATYKRHREHMHPLDQNLKCKTCGKTFPRLGGLIGHYESSQCESITENQLENVRKEKQQRYDTQKAASNFRNLNNFPSSVISNVEPTSSSEPINGRSNGEHSGTLVDRPDIEEDLISFADRKVTWDFVPKFNKTSIRTHPDSNGVQNSSELEGGGVSLVPTTNIDRTSDPYSPEFRAEIYFIPLLLKYKCPHCSCGKSFESRYGFISHMKSQAHRSRELQCKGCLRFFGSATALIQHSESQSLRCRIRELPDYEQVVDVMTSGVATVAGRLRDNTVAYATTKSGEKTKENRRWDVEW